MPNYDYRCATCGVINSLTRGYEDYSIDCPLCDGMATRIPVYRSQGIIVRGGPNATMPPRNDAQAIQEEYGKEVKKRGWSADRAVEELRSSKFEDSTGQLSIDTTKMTKEA